MYSNLNVRRYPLGGDGPVLAEIGTIAQVLAYKEENETNEVFCHTFFLLMLFRTIFQLTSLKMRAIGRQRFQLIETRRQLDGLAMLLPP